MELRQYILIVWKRWWLIALTTLLAAGVAYGLASRATPLYRSSTTLEVERGVAEPGQNVYWTIQNNEALASTFVLQVTAPTVMEEVVSRLQLDMTAAEARGYVSANQVQESNMIQISVQHPNPALAQALAAATAQVFIEQKLAQQQSRYTESLRELEAQVAALEDDIMETRGQVAALGEPQDLDAYGRAELARLETQLANDQTRLSVLLQSTEQFRLAMTRYSDHISIFTPAALPEAPFSPQPLRNTALAAAVGGMIGVGTIFLLDYLDDKVHAPEDAQRALGVNVLGALPDVKVRSGALAWESPLSPVAEAIRNLRTSLQYASLDNPLRTVVVTSANPEEGKSFTAANLATAFAVNGKRVLLLEADLRRPKLHRLWEQDRRPGLVEALHTLSEAYNGQREDGAGATVMGAEIEAVLAPYLRSTPVDNLSVLMAGDEVTTPAEVLGSQTFRQMVEGLLCCFDMIVIDTPPVLAVTDAAVLAPWVDGVVMVTASGQTRYPAAARAIERLLSVESNLLGLVVNRMTARSGGYTYYYYQYAQDYYRHDGAGGGANGRHNGSNGSDPAQSQDAATGVLQRLKRGKKGARRHA